MAKYPFQTFPWADDVEIRVEPRYADRPEGREADPNWRVVDKAGHGHFFSEGYPTLDLRYRGCGDPDHDTDCQGESYYACPLCDEEIQPRTCWVPARPRQVGCDYTLIRRTGQTTTSYHLSEKQYREVMSALAAATNEALDAVLRDEWITEQEWTG